MKERLFMLVVALCLFVSSVSAENKDSIECRLLVHPVGYKPEWKKLILPASLIAAGIIVNQTDSKDIFSIDRSDRNPRSTPIDNILTIATGPSVFLFDAFAEEKHHAVDQLFLLGTSYVFTAIPVLTMKNVFSNQRPVGGKDDSFPSAHTAFAFAGAHVVYKEFKDSNPWIAYSGYALATGVGALRMHNNRHWLSDVLTGAGIGILCSELAYAAYFPVRNHIADKLNKKHGVKASLSPLASSNLMGFNLSIRF